MNYNCKIIEYQDSIHIEFYDVSIKRSEEPKEQILTDDNSIDHIFTDENNHRSDKQIAHCLNVSKNRSKRNLYRIARSNSWDWFITLTFDQKKNDSSDYDLVVSKLKNYLQNLRKRRFPDLKYLIVPEFHKDGKHFHFHGLLSGVNDFEFVDSGHKDFLGETIYNIENWSKNLGYTTATKIKDNAKVTSYIGKYITKDMMNHLKYKRRYYASENCYVSPEEYYNIPYDELINGISEDINYISTIPINGVNRIKYIEVSKDCKFLIDR